MAKFTFKDNSVPTDWFAEKEAKKQNKLLEAILPLASDRGIEIQDSDDYSSVMIKIKKFDHLNRLDEESKRKAEAEEYRRKYCTGKRTRLKGEKLAEAEKPSKLLKDIGIKDLVYPAKCDYYNLWSGTVLKNCIPVKGVDRKSLALGYDKFGHPLTPVEYQSIHRAMRRLSRDAPFRTVCADWKYLSKFADWCDEHLIQGYELIVADPDETEYGPKTCLFVSFEDRKKRDWLVKFGECKAHSLGQIISDPLREVMRVWLENQK